MRARLAKDGSFLAANKTGTLTNRDTGSGFGILFCYAKEREGLIALEDLSGTSRTRRDAKQKQEDGWGAGSFKENAKKND